MSVLIRQLYDDLAPFYPITCMEAVIGGTFAEATIPEVIEMSQYITTSYSSDENPGIFRMYKYDNSLCRIILEVDTSIGCIISPGGNNIIAEGMPVEYYPDRPIILKTLTNDIKWKCVVMWDIDGKVRLCTLPYEEVTIDEDKKEIRRYSIMELSSISATGIRIL